MNEEIEEYEYQDFEIVDETEKFEVNFNQQKEIKDNKINENDNDNEIIKTKLTENSESKINTKTEFQTKINEKIENEKEKEKEKLIAAKEFKNLFF